VEPAVAAALVTAASALVLAGASHLRFAAQERLRNELARDLRQGEILGNLRSEVRLRMFTRAAESAEAASRSLQEFLMNFRRVADALVRSRQSLTSPANEDLEKLVESAEELWAKCLYAGLFLPPSLDEEHHRAVYEMVAYKSFVVSVPQDIATAGDYERAVREYLHAARGTCDRFFSAVRAWKIEQWTALAET
jgi:hypothetical protein